MLINIRISELQSNTWTAIPLAFLVLIALSSLYFILPYSIAILSNNYFSNRILIGIFKFFYYNHCLSFDFVLLGNEDCILSMVSSNMWDGYLAETGHIASIGSVMYTDYNIWLLISSFILLLAMVGILVIVFNPYASTSLKVSRKVSSKLLNR